MLREIYQERRGFDYDRSARVHPALDVGRKVQRRKFAWSEKKKSIVSELRNINNDTSILILDSSLPKFPN